MINKELNSLLEKILIELEYPHEFACVIKSNRPDLCDYQYDGAFKIAKQIHQNPFDIGKKIAIKFQEYPYFSKVECVKPGFVNFTLANKYINEKLHLMNCQPKYAIEMDEIKTYVIDYGGPNIAKPLHVGHLRSAIVGESIKRIIKYFGHKVISDVHFGDIGLQIGQVIYGLQKENIEPSAITINILERIYPEISNLCKENPTIKEQCAEITYELQNKNPQYLEYWQEICRISGSDIKRLYKFLDVDFDYWYGESDAYQYIEPLTNYLKQKNLLQESEGAIIIDANIEKDEELPPLLYQKSNKAYLYGTTDLATIYQRMQDFKPDYILYLTDARQALHFHQVFNVCYKSNLTKSTKLEHLPFGTVNGIDGKPFKTRAGKAPKLDDLFNDVRSVFISLKDSNINLSQDDQDKIVNSIIKFADLQNNREKDYIFDINKFSEVIGKTGPYILYTYLRMNKILKTYTINDYLSEEIYNDYDRNLRLQILDLENNLQNAYKYRMPSYIANYLYDLCVLLNAFYQFNHINNLEDVKKQQDWLYLLNLSNNIIKDMLELLGIYIPSEM